VDRNGEPFAISAPVKSVWVNPKVIEKNLDKFSSLAKLLKLNIKNLKRKINKGKKHEFIYIKRHISPELADEVMALKIPGVALQNEYHRYYPSGEVAAHVIGFSNIDDVGQEGIELAYDNWLKGLAGKKRVKRDRLGRTFDDIERIRQAQAGKPLTLSIDKRLQYLAYRTLKAEVIKQNAVAGSAVMLDVKTGEVLAMVNQPSFNVNNRKRLQIKATRNRAVTDVFEPGSTMKPLTMAAVLESGRWKPYYKVKTSPGSLRLNNNTIRDTHDYGDLDLGGVIEKSSNVGMSKIVLEIDPEQQWSMYQKLGLGMSTGTGFPGEASGRLVAMRSSNDFERANLSFGYGISVTPLQLAHAYSAIAADGVLRPVSFIRTKQAMVKGTRVMSSETARAIRKMMQRAVSDTGTGKKARVINYTVAGKTGTVHKFIKGGYAKDRYISIFAGMVPADNPEVVMVVMIDEPRKKDYYGGLVAAPVFSKVMSGAMRLLDVAPDKISKQKYQNANKLKLGAGA
jgi:cell division protein FtsI (penicillin-binding protein 3)